MGRRLSVMIFYTTSRPAEGGLAAALGRRIEDGGPHAV
jgi:hypothetical protein